MRGRVNSNSCAQMLLLNLAHVTHIAHTACYTVLNSVLRPSLLGYQANPDLLMTAVALVPVQNSLHNFVFIIHHPTCTI